MWYQLFFQHRADVDTGILDLSMGEHSESNGIETNQQHNGYPRRYNAAAPGHAPSRA